MDVNYIDLIENPMATVRSIYERFDWPLEARQLSTPWKTGRSGRHSNAGREKQHRYDLSDYGLTPEKVNAAFARYRNFITDRGIRSSHS